MSPSSRPRSPSPRMQWRSDAGLGAPARLRVAARYEDGRNRGGAWQGRKSGLERAFRGRGSGGGGGCEPGAPSGANWPRQRGQLNRKVGPNGKWDPLAFGRPIWPAAKLRDPNRPAKPHARQNVACLTALLVGAPQRSTPRNRPRPASIRAPCRAAPTPRGPRPRGRRPLDPRPSRPIVTGPDQVSGCRRTWRPTACTFRLRRNRAPGVSGPRRAKGKFVRQPDGLKALIPTRTSILHPPTPDHQTNQPPNHPRAPSERDVTWVVASTVMKGLQEQFTLA
jgi:hypothetical protein